MACQSAGDECSRTECYRQQFPIYDIPDDYEDPVSVVALASGWLCACERDRDEWLVVSDLLELVGESDCAKTWWCETLSAGGAVLFRANFGGLYARLCVESDRIGVGDADLHCVALIPKNGTNSSEKLAV